MSKLAFRSATADDWPAIERLLGAAALPTDGAADAIDRFLVATRGVDVVASAAIEHYDGCGLLRSVAASVGERGRGTGEDIVRRRLDRAHAEGLSLVVLLTTTAAAFFERFGFRQVSREDVPEPVRQSIEFTQACPASATVMRLDVTTAPVLVRRADVSDAAAIARIYNQGIEDQATLETEPRSAGDRAAWLGGRGPRHPVLVAVRADRVVGWVSLSAFNPREAYRFVADLGIYVGREARGGGLGSRLMDAILSRARDLGYHKVVLTTFPFSHQAVALYEKFGFRHVGDYREQGRLDRRWVDTRVMERILESGNEDAVERRVRRMIPTRLLKYAA